MGTIGAGADVKGKVAQRPVKQGTIGMDAPALVAVRLDTMWKIAAVSAVIERYTDQKR